MFSHDHVITALHNLGINLELGDKYKMTPAFYAASSGRLMELCALNAAGVDLNKGIFENGRTPLHEAVRKNRVDAVKLLCELGANPELKEGIYGSSPIHFSAELGLEEIIRYFISQNVNVHSVTTSGETTIYVAAKNNRPELISIFNDAGVDINKGDKDGDTPAFIAAYKGCFNALKRLKRFKRRLI